METKDVILELRTKKGLSQDELAEKVYVTRQAVSRWENGETIPNTETLKLLSGFFDVSINTLLGSPRNSFVNAVVCRLMIPRSVKNQMVLSMKNTVNGVIQTENSHMTILMI